SLPVGISLTSAPGLLSSLILSIPALGICPHDLPHESIQPLLIPLATRQRGGRLGTLELFLYESVQQWPARSVFGLAGLALERQQLVDARQQGRIVQGRQQVLERHRRPAAALVDPAHRQQRTQYVEVLLVANLVALQIAAEVLLRDRKSTRLNSSHVKSSYA